MFLGFRNVRFNFGSVLEQYQYKRRQLEMNTTKRLFNLIESTINQSILINNGCNTQNSQIILFLKTINPVQQPSTKQSLFVWSQTVNINEIALQSSLQDHNLPFLQQIQGLYVFVSPRFGKTYIMDLFYKQFQIPQKKRIYFNEFMLDIQKDLQKCSSKKDPIQKVGTAKAKDLRLLCLDKFQVTDLGDALLLKRLFETMINNHMITENAARRFILLIDEMYNHKTKLYCCAERNLMNLFILKSK